MQLDFPLVAQNVDFIYALLLPVAFLHTGAQSALHKPLRHSLFITGVAWLLTAVCLGWKTRRSGGEGGSRLRKLSVLAGLLYALAQVCERVGVNRENYWWTKSLLPLFTFILLRSGLDKELDWLPNHEHEQQASTEGGAHISGGLVLAVTAIAATALHTVWTSSSTATLGVTSSLLTASALLLLGGLLRSTKQDGPLALSTNGHTQSRSEKPEKRLSQSWAPLRDAAFTIGAMCLCVSLSTECFRNDGMAFSVKRKDWTVETFAEDEFISGWQPYRFELEREQDISSLLIEFPYVLLLVNLIRREGAVPVAYLSLGAVFLAKLLHDFTTNTAWLAFVFTAISLLALNDSNTVQLQLAPRRRRQARQAAMLLASITIVTKVFTTLEFSPPPSDVGDSLFTMQRPMESLGPMHLANTTSHPIAQLVKQADDQFKAKLARQSKTLAEATTEYRRRYGIPPPPYFDVWFEVAKAKNIQLIDEFDSIYDTLLPFWGLKPEVIRKRVSEALGLSDNYLLTVAIREGEVVNCEGGPEWQQKATLGMMENFVRYLPDMDLAFNLHDEPRVVVPNDVLSKLVKVANEENLPPVIQQTKPQSIWTERPADLGDGKRIKESKISRFNKFLHQQTWTQSRLSCSLESPARNYDEQSTDNVTGYALTSLGFVYNHSAFNDICMSPSLRETYGFFDRPNAFNVAQDLIPIFSQSKLSSFQDILYPSPWYWADKVPYNLSREVDWDDKHSSLYWRGSTTGGYSRSGGWRRHHRQRVVRKLNERKDARILADGATQGHEGEPHTPDWQPVDTSRKEHRELVDVKFSYVGQCDPGDCDAQREFFDVVDLVDQQDAWSHKFLLDMDGNAFSGRFYAFLKSRSLVFKMSMFQEWHREWLQPWLHYIPMSLIGDEWLETVRYFVKEEEGRDRAPRLASHSQYWANNALRNIDLEVWMFRLLLEYGRLIDDNREIIGYPGP